MNRAELCEAIAKDMKGTKAEADRFLSSMLGCLTKGLKKDKARLEEMGRQNVRLRYDRSSTSE